MDGENKLTLIIVCLIVICLTVLYSFLFISLWNYREYVGLSLLALVIAAVVVFLRGRLKEQDLREVRFRHNDETPLDQNGEPMLWHQGNLPNPHRR